jgi:hypothetical protein
MRIKYRTPKPTKELAIATHDDGSTFKYEKTVHHDPVVAPPRDWDMISTRVAVAMVLVLTAVAVAWSTWSIGSLLHGGIGYLAAIVFDLSWGTALILEWKSRYDDDKRTFPLVLGWGLLAVTMGAIFWHAMPDLRYAVIGAVVSGVAKILWLGIMKHIEVTLSEEDKGALKDKRSKAGVRMAMASVDRQVERLDAQTAAVRLSLEPARPAGVHLSASDQDTDPVELHRVAQYEADKLRKQIAGSGSAQSPESFQPDPDPVRIPESGSVTPIRNASGSGSVKDSVLELIRNGTTDPAELVAALPKANPETVKKMARMYRDAGGAS